MAMRKQNHRQGIVAALKLVTALIKLVTAFVQAR
jgi:hypothetical protein